MAFPTNKKGQTKKKQTNNKHKTHKHFSDGPLWGQSPQGRTPTPSQGQRGQNGNFTVELKQKKAGWSQGRVPICPAEGVPFVSGTVPVCPRHRPAQNVYVYWFFFLARSLKKTVFGMMFLSAPQSQPWSKEQFFFYCRLAVSENREMKYRYLARILQIE